MHAGHCVHVFVHLFNVLCSIDYAYSISERSQWEDSSTSFKFPSNTSFTNVSSRMRQDVQSWNYQKSLVTEESTFFTTSAINSADNHTTVESRMEETSERFVDISNPRNNRSDEETHASSLVESESQDLMELDSDNVIDTSGDVEIQSQKHHNRVRAEEAEIPECQLVEPPLAQYKAKYVWNSEKPMKNPEPRVGTLEQTKDGELHVEDLIIFSTTPNMFAVSWKRPNSTANITYYLVEWYLDSASKNCCKVSNETNIHAIEITSLKTCTSYTVKVMPYLGTNIGSERVVTGTTGIDVHNDSLSLKIITETTDSLMISWSMPNTDCVNRYVIEVCGSENCTQTNTTATTFTQSDLSPCVTYFVNLTVWGHDHVYGTVDIIGTTKFLKPGQPAEANTTSGNHSLTVSWKEPIGHTCVKHYRVTWTLDESQTEITDQTELELTDLEACALYEIIIIAVWDGGESLPERIISERTAPDATDPPLALQEPSVTESKISIKWLINTNMTNNCDPMVLIVNCTAQKTLGEGYISSNGSAVYSIQSGTTNVTQNTEVENLSAFTRYTCHSVTINSGGQSPERKLAITADTLEAVPSEPKLWSALQSNVTNTSIELVWNKPTYLPGILRNITIKVIWEYSHHRPSWCTEPIRSVDTIFIDGNLTGYVYNAKPSSRYNIRIFAATGAGWGNASDYHIYITPAGTPSEVTKLKYLMDESSLDPNILDVTIIWGIPCFVNAPKIEYFYITGSGKRNGFEEHVFDAKVSFTNKSCYNDSCALMIDNLREEHTYKFQISTKAEGYNYLGDVAELTIPFPAGIPPPPDENYTSLISIDPYKARRTATTATVLLPIFSDTGGTIRCYAIIVSKLGYNNGTFARFKNNSSLPYTASWSESKYEFEIPYQAVNFCTDSYPSYVADYGRLKAVKFVLGEDTETCPKISSKLDKRSFCNGPLKSDTWYHVRMRAFTDGGYRDSVIFTVKTNAELQVAVVIGTIFGILFLGILTTMMLLVRKCSLQAVLRRFLHSDMPGSPVPAPFTRRKFIAHCQQLADNPGKLSNEYQLLQTLSVDLQMPTNAACLQANRKKNRYTDILPYDFSRVKLGVIDNDPNTDYINASFIKGFTGDEDYIACQGPKEDTTYDFWRMIDQYDVKIIVMLTQLVEKNKEKCHQYFPTIRETFTYENMAIRCTSELDYRTYTDRTLILQKENEKRFIIHLHFKDWPDHDVPEDFDPMINFCQIMRRHMEANRGLVVVHCSAGIGRTGTLIAIDILLQHIKENRKLDVFGTVYRLRHHRINMVQRESQYAYIYNCIKQVLKNPYFSKTYKPPSVDPIFDNNSHKKKEASDSSTNLVSSLETLKKSSFSTSGESAEPIYQTSLESTSKSRTCYPLNGLRCAKSTSAIDTRPCQKLMGRYNTHDHPISDMVSDCSEMKDSDISFDITESDGSTTSLYENMQPLLRSKSAHAFGRDEDSCVNQKLLEHDTSL